MKHLLLLLLIALSFASCEKQELFDDMGNEITRSEAIQTLDVKLNQPSISGKGAASPEIVITINGNENTFTLNRDHFYDDGADSDIHYSQTYDRRAVIGQDAEGNDITERVIIYFDILVNVDTQELITGSVDVESHDTSFAVSQSGFSQISAERIIYNLNGLSFNLEL